MTDTAFEMIRQEIHVYLRAPFVRAVMVCDDYGDVVAGAGDYGDHEGELLRGMSSTVFPPVRHMVEQSGYRNEAQSISLPDADVHLLIFWLTLEYYLVVFFSMPQNPYNPPGSAIKIWEVIRSILQSPQPGEALSILCADLEMEIGLERLVYFDKKEIRSGSNFYDLPDLEVRREQIVTIARDMLNGRLGIIAGARLLARLRPTVTRDDFDPDFQAFVVIDSETDDLPLGREREFWSPDALLEADRKIRAAEEFHRKNVFAACRIILDRFG